MNRRALGIVTAAFAVFLLGTIVVLGSVVQFFGIYKADVVREDEMATFQKIALGAAIQEGVDIDLFRIYEDPLGGDPIHKLAELPVDPAILSLELKSTPEGTVIPLGDGTAVSLDRSVTRVSESSYPVRNVSMDDVRSIQALALAPRSAPPKPYRQTSRRELVSINARGSAAHTTLIDPVEIRRVPKIIHQTWKTNTLPPRYAKVREQCSAIHPDYDYMLWTDESSREFIATEFPWFLPIFDAYPYNIQRADLIRYFVLYKYGGIYMDIDIGCRRRLDALLYFPTVLMQTIPVGVSNDCMFSSPQNPFLAELIQSLKSHQHSYGTHYPTVMFSTGPMFVSGVYTAYERNKPRGSFLRILPKRWYGKNAPKDTKDDWFFNHYYGSSWHNSDSSFIIFLGRFGSALLYFGFVVTLIASLRLVIARSSSRSSSRSPRLFRQRNDSFTPLPRVNKV